MLVRPRSGGNIGSVLRICKNFGYSPPYVIAPSWFERNSTIQEETKRLAWNASDLLSKVKYFRKIEDAIDGFDLTIVTGSNINGIESFTPEGAKRRIHHLKAKRVAILFGSENSGLSKKEASFGSWNIKIPTSNEYPDLNLSHAVAIIASKLSTIKQVKKQQNLLKSESAVFLIPEIEYVLKKSSFLRENNLYLLNEIRSFLSRIRPAKREIILLRGILRKLKASLKK